MKKNIYPCKPQFYYIKVGFKGVKIILGRSLTNTQIMTMRKSRTAPPQAITAIAQLGNTSGFSVVEEGSVRGGDVGEGVVGEGVGVGVEVVIGSAEIPESFVKFDS